MISGLTSDGDAGTGVHEAEAHTGCGCSVGSIGLRQQASCLLPLKLGSSRRDFQALQGQQDLKVAKHQSYRIKTPSEQGEGTGVGGDGVCTGEADRSNQVDAEAEEGQGSGRGSPTLCPLLTTAQEQMEVSLHLPTALPGRGGTALFYPQKTLEVSHGCT